jgi:ribonucleoside-diphosphate reductase alpha chain
MYVIKRDGQRENVRFDAIQDRLNALVNMDNQLVDIDVANLTQKIITSMTDGIHTSEIDTIAARQASSLAVRNGPDYGVLASRLYVSNHQRNTLSTFHEKFELLYASGQINEQAYRRFLHLRDDIDIWIDYSRDYIHDYFGMTTLMHGYLLRIDGLVIERPQDMFMRVALQVTDSTYNKDNVKAVYDSLSLGFYTHATPTLFNSCTIRNSLSSCYLLGVDDNTESIGELIKNMMKISACGGGIGVHVHNIREHGSPVKSIGGVAAGVTANMGIMNSTMRAYKQGGGKRRGSTAVYIEAHHPDLIEFLSTRTNTADYDVQCRDLFLALWVTGLFMERTIEQCSQKDKEVLWHTFSPTKYPELNDLHGPQYTARYLELEATGDWVNEYPIRNIWKSILACVCKTGLPYICNKDEVNRSNQQRNLGTIRSSNLCTEIMLYSDNNEYACCNIASICLPKFVYDTSDEPNDTYPKSPAFNYKLLNKKVQELVYNLNTVIDTSYLPCQEIARSNFKHRPIGIGIQGLADTFLKLRISFGSPEAIEFNKRFSECIYYAAVGASTKLCRVMRLEKVFNDDDECAISLYPQHVLDRFPDLVEENVVRTYTNGHELPHDVMAYSSFDKDDFKFHWENYENVTTTYEWDNLRTHIQKYGLRNSVVTAYMPTATTSQIMGNSIAFEPYAAQIYGRDTTAGNFPVFNKYLVNDLREMGIPITSELIDNILVNKGSVQYLSIDQPAFLDRYKTAYEIPKELQIRMAADRQPFVDQSQSLNIYVDGPIDMQTLLGIQVLSYKYKLKTHSYYIRGRSAARPQLFSLSATGYASINSIRVDEKKKYLDEDDSCAICES